MQFFGKNTAVARGINKESDTSSYDFVIRTDNGAKTWQAMPRIPNARANIYFISPLVGWAAGGDQYEWSSPYSTTKILHTTDGGLSWIVQLDTNIMPYENFYEVKFSDENYGIALGNKNIFWRTTNGGKLWKYDSTLTYAIHHRANCISYPKKSIIYATNAEGGNVYKWDEEINRTEKEIVNSQYSLHPNPATSQITLSLSEEFISEPEIEIIDYIGNTIRWTPSARWSPSDKTITINTSSLTPGVYFLRVRSGEKVELKKFVVVR